ncbi:CDP-glycerol glycerophosphotransferase family protein [Algoriphagus aquatilis]|uniref:CDP-glycerol glycerophosphotransferase family protein n=1 Tax=Algoriphagus aquatilis TaxID=490186 RepID=A0ABW0BVR3_9BACT
MVKMLLIGIIKRFLFFFYQLKARFYQKRIINKIKGKDKINVIFLVIHESVWKYSYLYDLLEKSERFNPVVVVCPYLPMGENVMIEDLNKCYEFFKTGGYRVVKSLKDNNKWLDVNRELDPTIVFFTNPHNLTRKEYLITSFLNSLTCYVPYNFGNSHLISLFHDQDFHNYLWNLFCETEIHKEYSVKFARNRGRNVLTTGYPGGDMLLIDKIPSDKIWKHKDKKKIIWAPHHTIDNDRSFISFSSFLYLSDFFIEILKEYEKHIEICFKPHPLLKGKLYLHPEWGLNKTNEYFDLWETLSNASLNESDYFELFLTSDALIHDSGSFLIEYLYTEKPTLRTDKDDTIKDRLNSFGKLAYNVHYIAKNKEDIREFLENVIEGRDPKKNERLKFKNSYLIPPNGKLASENIFYQLTKLLK